MSKQPPSASTASAIGPCSTIIQIVGRPGTGSYPGPSHPPPPPPKFCIRQEVTHIFHFPGRVLGLSYAPLNFSKDKSLLWLPLLTV